MLYEDITGSIIKVFYKVNRILGFGFLEKVYENAMLLELQHLGYETVPQARLQVMYNNVCIGTYFADLLIDGKVIVELKCAEAIRDEHQAQLVNYLRASRIEVGLLLNFGRKPEFKRKIFTNHRV